MWCCNLVCIQIICYCRFLDFYNLIAHNFALIPALASESYYDRKFSSTLITSLVTNTPVIVDHRFLQVCNCVGQYHHDAVRLYGVHVTSLMCTAADICGEGCCPCLCCGV